MENNKKKGGKKKPLKVMEPFEEYARGKSDVSLVGFGSFKARTRTATANRAKDQLNQDYLSLYFSLNEYNAEEISDIISHLSDVYHSIGGDHLVIKGMQQLTPQNAMQPIA